MNDAQVRENVLDEAKKCVLHDRNSTYGKPEDNFRRIAELWTAYLGIRPKDVGASITPTDVAQMMLLMKVARLAHNPTHKDSWVDGIGYLACGAGIELGENQKKSDCHLTPSELEAKIRQTYGEVSPCQIPSTSSGSQS